MKKSESLTLKPEAAAIVDKSTRGWVQFMGDVLGPALDVGSLVQLPSGCGEQIMINLAPNVFVVSYLEEFKNDVNDKEEEKDKNNEKVESGKDGDGQAHERRKRMVWNLMPVEPDPLPPLVPQPTLSNEENVVERAKKFIQTGYEKELKYRHRCVTWTCMI